MIGVGHMVAAPAATIRRSKPRRSGGPSRLKDSAPPEETMVVYGTRLGVQAGGAASIGAAGAVGGAAGVIAGHAAARATLNSVVVQQWIAHVTDGNFAARCWSGWLSAYEARGRANTINGLDVPSVEDNIGHGVVDRMMEGRRPLVSTGYRGIYFMTCGRDKVVFVRARRDGWAILHGFRWTERGCESMSAGDARYTFMRRDCPW